MQRAAVLVAIAFLAAACAPQPLVQRAIRARGGPISNLVRRVEADVFAGFPGMWRWRTAFAVPNRYAWTIETRGEANHYLFDGQTMRAFVGSLQVGEDPSADAALRTHARFVAVAALDVLLLPGVRVGLAAEVPDGTAAALDVVFTDDGARYRLGFDAMARLIWLEGRIALPPLADGPGIARFEDFRSIERLLLPFRTRYELGGTLFADERALAVCPNVPGLTDASFRSPERLPECP